MNNLQKFVQRKCVMAAHTECETYAEALTDEVAPGCIIQNLETGRYFKTIHIEKLKISKINYVDDVPVNSLGSFGLVNIIGSEKRIYSGDVYFVMNGHINLCEINKFEIIGQPCTLSRVMMLLTERDVACTGLPLGLELVFCVASTANTPLYEKLFKWKFKNKDGTDSLFKDQSEETQKAIAKLLGYDDKV